MADKRRARRRKLLLHPHIFLLLVGLALLIGAVKLWGPMSVARQQRRELDGLAGEKAAEQQEHKRLEEYQRGLATDEGREAAARRDGYVREGERRVVFVKEKEKAKQ